MKLYKEHKHLLVYVCIMDTRYLKLTRDPDTGEWMRIEYSEHHYDAQNTEHPINRALTSDYKDMEGDRFWSLLHSAATNMINYFNARP